MLVDGSKDKPPTFQMDDSFDPYQGEATGSFGDYMLNLKYFLKRAVEPKKLPPRSSEYGRGNRLKQKIPVYLWKTVKHGPPSKKDSE